MKACEHSYWVMVPVPPDDCDHECFCDITGQTCTSSYQSGEDRACDPVKVKEVYDEENRRFREDN